MHLQFPGLAGGVKLDEYRPGSFVYRRPKYFTERLDVLVAGTVTAATEVWKTTVKA